MSRWSCMLCYALGAMSIKFWFNQCSTVEVNKEYTIISADNLFLSFPSKQKTILNSSFTKSLHASSLTYSDILPKEHCFVWQLLSTARKMKTQEPNIYFDNVFGIFVAFIADCSKQIFFSSIKSIAFHCETVPNFKSV